MARTEARIRCSIWDDPDFLSLTWEAQWLYHAILEQKDLSLCGVLTWTPKRFAKLAPNIRPADVKRAMDLLRERRFIVLDDDTDELWVRTFIKGDRVDLKPNSIIGMAHDFGAIHSQPIRQGLLQGLGQGFLDELPQRFERWKTGGFDKRIPQAFREAFALVWAHARPRTPVPPASSLQPPASVPSEHRSSSSLDGVRDAGAEEEDSGQEPQDPVAHVCRLVAERRHDKRSEPIPEGIRRDRWLVEVGAKLRIEAEDDIRAMLAAGRSVAEVVDRLEPPGKPPASEPVPSREHVPCPLDEVWDEAAGEWRLVDRTLA
jgi:hypothetical protein